MFQPYSRNYGSSFKNLDQPSKHKANYEIYLAKVIVAYRPIPSPSLMV
jgi:hypothetical protein